MPQDIKDEIRAELQAEEAPGASAAADDPEQSIDTSETAESWDAGWPRLAPTSSLPQGETYEELLALDDQTEAEGLPPNEVARLTAEQQVNTDRLQTRRGGPNAFSHRWRCVPAHAGAAPSFRRQRRGQVQDLPVGFRGRRATAPLALPARLPPGLRRPALSVQVQLPRLPLRRARRGLTQWTQRFIV